MVMKSLSCLVLLPSSGASPAEKWVHRGQVAATLDLLDQLRAVPLVDEITLMTPEIDTFAATAGDVRLVRSSVQNFQFGQTLLNWAQAHDGLLAYFGGSSAPLLKAESLTQLTQRLGQSGEPTAITNNKYSSDWLLFNGLHEAEEFVLSLETDNPLGWGLENQVGWRVEDLPASSVSRTDIDTPWDLLMLQGHPGLGPHLEAWLAEVDEGMLAKIDSLRDLLRTPAKTLMVIGRSSSVAWQLLEDQTQVWTRMFAEERSMLASGRLRRGEVRSLLGKYIETVGLDSFLKQVESMADGLLWDNRVWLASSGGWPSRADRFAADLGWRSEVSDPRLSQLIEATQAVSIPVLSGGHAVVSGGLMALLETL